MKKTIIAATALALTAACGGESGEANEAAGTANSGAVAPDHDEAVPTPAAEENHGHEHDGTEPDNHAH